MKIPLDKKLSTRFMDNYFCIIPNTQIAFVVISKNGCTFLKKTAIYNESDVWVEDFETIHDLIGYNANSKYLIPVPKMKEYEVKHSTFIKIAIWRDPIERVISTYKLFCLEREYRTYFHFLGINDSISFDRFMDFLRFEWGKKDPIMQDEHIRKQTDYFKFDQIDFIIPIEKLYDFLEEKGVKFIKEQSNETIGRFKIESNKYIDEIKEYYKPDYDITLNY